MFKWTLLGFRWPPEVSQRQWWMKGVWRSALSPEPVFRDLEPSQLLEWKRIGFPCTGTCVIHECWMGSANTWHWGRECWNTMITCLIRYRRLVRANLSSHATPTTWLADEDIIYILRAIWSSFSKSEICCFRDAACSRKSFTVPR